MKSTLISVYIAMLATIMFQSGLGVYELVFIAAFGIVGVALGYVTAKDHFE